jgi:hypothetical protein
MSLPTTFQAIQELRLDELLISVRGSRVSLATVWFWAD